ncbi:MAG: hypothetical protein WD081_06430 [Gammaproteobacteria bacterium]
MRTHTGKFTGRIGALRFLPMGAAEARARLSGLQLNPRLAPYVRNEIKACDAALRALEARRDDREIEEAARQIQEQVEETIRLAKRRYEQSGRMGRDRPIL